MVPVRFLSVAAAIALLAGGCSGRATPNPPQSAHPDGRSGTVLADRGPAGDRERPDPPPSPVLPLFDGKELAPWQITRFGGEGEVAVSGGEIEIAAGTPLSGIHWKGEPPPASGYRIGLDAMRTAGTDFFCCLTFPVAEGRCSLVVGGWSGTVVGLSCIDGEDASENATTQRILFDDNRWYRIEVEVTAEAVRASIDGRWIIDQPVAGHIFSVRGDVVDSGPLGICTYRTSARLRNLVLTRIPMATDPPAGSGGTARD